MQDPNADTEWNDVLRSKGILPPKEKEVTEEDIVKMVEDTIDSKSKGKTYEDMTKDVLDALEDDITEDDEKVFESYRRQRLLEMRTAQQRARFGDVSEISKVDYVREVNEAGPGVWVILHVYKPSIPLCKLVNNHLQILARKFPETKFLISVSSVCIPNYPDKNLPTIFVYFEGEIKKQFLGPMAFGGMNLTQDDLEWMLAEAGAVTSNLEERPRKEVTDALSTAILRSGWENGDDDEDD